MPSRQTPSIQGKAPSLENIGSERTSGEEDLPVINMTDVLRVLRTRKILIIGTAALVAIITVAGDLAPDASLSRDGICDD